MTSGCKVYQGQSCWQLQGQFLTNILASILIYICVGAGVTTVYITHGAAATQFKHWLNQHIGWCKYLKTTKQGSQGQQQQTGQDIVHGSVVVAVANITNTTTNSLLQGASRRRRQPRSGPGQSTTAHVMMVGGVNTTIRYMDQLGTLQAQQVDWF